MPFDGFQEDKLVRCESAGINDLAHTAIACDAAVHEGNVPLQVCGYIS